ncbi:MAG: DUF6263 family protein, partial [Planctomycetaceae bacterium]
MPQRFHVHCIACLVLAISVPAAASAQQMLVWKFSTGDVFFVEEVVLQEQSVTIGDRTDTKKTRQTTITQFRVLNATPNGNVDLEITIESILDGGGQSNDVTRRISGSKFELTLDSKGQLNRFDGYSNFIKRVANGNIQFERLFQSVLSEDTLQQTMVQLLTSVPGTPVNRGQSWQQKHTLNVGPFGTLEVDRSFSHKGVVNRDGGSFVNVGLMGAAKYRLPDPDKSRLPFKVTKGALKVDRFQGSGSFDLQRQRMQTLDVELHVTGILTISVGPQQAELTIDQTQTSTLRV